MHIFYSKLFDGKRFTLDETESRHLSKVLRLKQGDKVRVIDGSGSFYNCKVLSSDHKMSILEVISLEIDPNKRNYNLHIAIAPTKNVDRFEWFVEKSVEIGIDKITPIICDRSERRVIKTARSKKIIISAMKQSLKSKETIIEDAIPFSQLLAKTTESDRYIAHCSDEGTAVNITELIHASADAIVLIGPEGDFTPAELIKANDGGFTEIGLGSSRLRTETAGVIACSSFYFKNM